MHPVMIAYQSQLLFNTVIADIYIKQAQSFNPTTQVRTGNNPIIITSIPAVEEPTQRIFKTGPGAKPQQVYELIITFPIFYLGTNKIKLNDFVALSTIDNPFNKQRYEVKSITTISHLLMSLGLLEHDGESLGLTYSMPPSDTLAFVESMEVTL